jgi:hypothetical protein
LLRGKFTIGADVAAAAGPVGRNAAAATDARLKAEILSYSRSRGLFAGLSLDGSAIEVDPVAQTTFYGSGPGQPPIQVPESAAQLVSDVTQLTAPGAVQSLPGATTGPALGPSSGAVDTQPGLATPPAGAPQLAVPDGMTLRESLAAKAVELQAIVDPGWQKYLALPREVFEGPGAPSVESLQQALRNYDVVAGDAKYGALTSRAEFQTTHRLLQEYVRQLTSSSRQPLSLPAPPLR